jgi:HD-GYP domain-containing protein (c-di-GMP phosphodiesterase class II)
MVDLKKEQVEVNRLALGMYVAELDRPWIGTPFMLQGFLLEDQADIDSLMSLCTFVYIDRTKSTGSQFISPAKQNVAIKREGSIVKLKDPTSKKPEVRIIHSEAASSNKQANKISFMDVLTDIKNQPAKSVSPSSQDGTVYNLRYGASTAAQEALPHEAENNVGEQNSLAKQLAKDVGGFIGGLFKREKFKNTASSDTDKKADVAQDDDYRITIYEEEPPVEIEIAAIVPVYEQSQIATRDIFESVANEQHLDLTAVSEILDNMVESIGRTPDALLWLAKLKKTDDYAYNHALNVSITLMAFGNFLALSKKQIKELGLAGLLQDVGKVKISSDILLKEGKLTHEEFEHAKKHVDESLKILETTPNIPNTAIFLVAQHHERIDGSGYPYQLKKNQIGLMSQAAGLIDTYCAITSHKSYAKGVFHQQALDEIHSLSGKQFSTELVDQLVQFMGMYPVSSLVELNTGEVAVVIQQNQVRRLLPRLMLLLDPNKVRYDAPVILNLLNNPSTPSGEPYKITRSLAPDSYGLSPDDFYL